METNFSKVILEGIGLWDPCLNQTINQCLQGQEAAVNGTEAENDGIMRRSNFAFTHNETENARSNEQEDEAEDDDMHNSIDCEDEEMDSCNNNSFWYNGKPVNEVRLASVINTIMLVDGSVTQHDNQNINDGEQQSMVFKNLATVECIILDLRKSPTKKQLRTILASLTFCLESTLGLLVNKNCSKHLELVCKWLARPHVGANVSTLNFQPYCPLDIFHRNFLQVLTKLPNLSRLVIYQENGVNDKNETIMPEIHNDEPKFLVPKLKEIFLRFDQLLDKSFLYWLACLDKTSLEHIIFFENLKVPLSTQRFYSDKFQLYLDGDCFHAELDSEKPQLPIITVTNFNHPKYKKIVLSDFLKVGYFSKQKM